MSEITRVNLPYQAVLIGSFLFCRTETCLTQPYLTVSRTFPRTRKRILVANPLARIQSITQQPADALGITTPLYALSNTSNPMVLLNELNDAHLPEPWAQAAPKEPTFHRWFTGVFGYDGLIIVEQLPEYRQKHDIQLAIH